MAREFSGDSKKRVADAEKYLKETRERRAAEKAAKEAAKKAYWAEYHEQLAKMTPHEGGAVRHRSRVFQIWGHSSQY